MSAIADALGMRIDFFAAFLSWALIFTRIYIVVLLTPFLGTRAVPGRARTAISIALATFLYVTLAPSLDEFPKNNGIIFALFLKEMFFGFTIGLVTLMMFYAFEAAGRIIDNQRGGANAQVFVPQLGQVSIFGLFNFWLAIAIFLGIGGHRHFLEAFFLSYQVVPVLQIPTLAPGLSPFLQFIIRLSGDVLVIAVQLSAPVLIATLLLDVVLGIANKMAPQINVFELGHALKGYAAILMVYVSLLILASQMNVFMRQMIQSVSEASRLFGS